ncbi:MAG TPA: YceI family protein [Bacteroidia bacterium]|jgi:polyisoprenoid-binding protein YceI|nr:YceI family protein [Bacteroidia bacterium]
MVNQTKWALSPQNSEIAFKVKHAAMGYIKGAFKTFEAHFYTNENEIALVKMNLMIDSSSMTTDDEYRDEYLKSADFLNVQGHKQIKFVSTVINKPDSDGNCSIWGELTMKGITKLIKLNVQFGKAETDLFGNKKVGLSIRGNIYRSDWDLFWNQTSEPFGFMVSEEVMISCSFELHDPVQKTVYKQLGPIVNENQHELSGSRGSAA